VRRLLVCLLALLAALAVACGSLQSYAAIVNGNRIAERDVDNELKAIRGNAKYLDAIDPSRRQILGSGTNTFNADFTAFVLNQDIDYLLVRQEVQKRKLKVTAADRTQARDTVVQQVNGQETLNLFPKWYQQKLQDRFADVIVLARSFSTGGNDAQLLDYYNAHRDQFEQVCASHILVDSKQKADELEARLAKGEDFAAVAKSDSKDQGSAAKGGEVGCFSRSARLVPEFLQAAFAQQVGQTGPPVQTQFGFHIIKVTSRKIPPFADVKAEVQQAAGQGGGQKLQQWITDALKKASVKLNPKFGRFNKSKSVPQVEAPQAPAGQTPTTAPAPPAPGG
jgi:parvulin-like peptidyl-prolyl isomerase